MDITCGIYLYNTHTQKFLIGHATRSKASWSIPKGLKDEGEDELKAAIREMEEETGLDLNRLDVLAIHPLPQIQYKKQKKLLASFLVITATDLHDTKLVCRSLVNGQFPEINKFMWVDIGEMGRMVHEAQVQNIPLIKELLEQEEQKKAGE